MPSFIAIANFIGLDQPEGNAAPVGSLIFEPASSVASGQINANKPLDQNFTFTRASTATFLGSNNLLQTAASGMPRIDYVGNSSGHILLEPSRTNIFRQSNNLSNNTWWSERSSFTLTGSDKNITSPTGTDNDAWTLSTNDLGGNATVGFIARNNGTNNHTIDASTSQTVSIFVKKSSYDFVYFKSKAFQSEMNGSSWFNISAGVLGTKSPNHNVKIEDYGNGWYRLSVTVTAPASPTDNVGQFNWFVSNADNTGTVQRDGTSTSFWYGGQIEVGEYSTSYIETTTAYVTRVTETASGAGNSTLFNDSEGVLFAEISGFVDTDDYRIISINAGNSSNTLFVGLRNDTGNVYFFLISNGSTQATYISNVNATNTNVKLAVKYKENDVSFYVNGFKLYQDTSATMISGLNQLDCNYGNPSSNFPFYGKIKQIKVYNTALTDAELASLTT